MERKQKGDTTKSPRKPKIDEVKSEGSSEEKKR
jgi:hypothetical protein